MSAADVARRGVLLASAELERRGASVRRLEQGRSQNRLGVVLPRGNAVDVYVKTRSRGTWQTDIRRGSPRSESADEGRFWVFVDLTTEPTTFYLAPAWWVENDIYETHQAYLARHGGTRARTPASTHHSIPVERIAEWRERWDLLDLGLERRGPA
jgi:hypothetical protein